MQPKKSKTRLGLWAIALLLILPSFRPHSTLSVQSTNTPSWGCPLLNPGEKITKHSAYSVSYNHKHMQANWVAYELKLSNTQGLAERESRFIVDPIILPHTARTEDYTKSGFDRGHLAPAADMKPQGCCAHEHGYSPVAFGNDFCVVAEGVRNALTLPAVNAATAVVCTMPR